MGRLVRRFIRCHDITITNKATINKVQAIDFDGDINALNPITEIAGGVTVAAPNIVRSAYVQTFLGALAEVTTWEGMRVNMACAGDSVIASLSALHINNFVQVQPAGRYCFFDLRENAPGITVDAAIYMALGGTTDITNLFELASGKTAWSSAVDPPGAALGRIAVLVGGVQRYIQLYQP